MWNNISLCFLVLTFLFAQACNRTSETKEIPAEDTSGAATKNIVLLIGDGMGLSQISSAFFQEDYKPNFGRFKHIGLIKTSSSRQKITDSAAGATALASGVKTYNGAIGVADDSVTVPTILEQAHESGLATGAISTSSITHATPAAFYSHVVSRGMQEKIAEGLLSGSVDFFSGGGTNFFARRSDGRDLLSELKEIGYIIDTTVLADTHEQGKKYGYLMAPNGMPPVMMGRGDFLQKSTQLALEHLSKNEKGFFLIVEGSQIDWGGHENNGEYLESELLDFDKTIGAVLDFAEKDGNTLVVVTADHETGGYALSSTPKTNTSGQPTSDYNEITGTFSTGGHTATLIPVFAFGPGAELFNGVYENNLIYHKMIEAKGEQF